jgi:hypothetical protein
MPCHKKEWIREKLIAGKIDKFIPRIAINVGVLLNERQQVDFFLRVIIPIAAAAVFQACNAELGLYAWLCVYAVQSTQNNE